MKKFLVCAGSAFILVLSAGSAAEARDGFYLAIRGGYTDYNLNSFKDDNAASDARVELDSVWHISGALGYKYKYFRIEGEYTYHEAGDSKNDAIITGEKMGTNFAHMETDSLMLNAYLDIMPNYWISPYVMGGIGLTQLKFESYDMGIGEGSRNNELSYDKTNFSWQWGGGLSLRLNRCLNLDAGYQYINFNKLHKGELNAHLWLVGLRYTF